VKRIKKAKQESEESGYVNALGERRPTRLSKIARY